MSSSALLKANAKRMRLEMTDAEKRLWTALRQNIKLKSTHFRRQVVLEGFIVDFCCLSERLIIEVDGAQHGFDQNLKSDQKRTKALEAAGFKVLRFWNHQIFKEFESVVDTIFAQLKNVEN